MNKDGGEGGKVKQYSWKLLKETRDNYTDKWLVIEVVPAVSFVANCVRSYNAIAVSCHAYVCVCACVYEYTRI